MTDTDVPDRALTPDAVATLLGVSPSTVRRLVRRGLLPPPIRVGDSPRWLASELAAWLRDRRATGTPDDAA